MLSPDRAALAQYCIGTTAYIVRDEAGAVMSTDQLGRLSVQINGIPATRLTNPLTFGINGIHTACGQLGDLTLTSGGKTMHLLFDIREHNTYFEIDGLSYREGTFHLRSLECLHGARPPVIDNNSSGKCLVPAERWEGADKEWVRYVLAPTGRAFAGSTTVPLEECRTRTLDAVTERAASDSLLAAYPSLGEGYWRDFDLRVQFLLAVHQTIGATYSLKSFRVDKRGDLTYEPPPPRPGDGGTCTAMYVVLYRSGIRSINGVPLPPASATP